MVNTMNTRILAHARARTCESHVVTAFTRYTHNRSQRDINSLSGEHQAIQTFTGRPQAFTGSSLR